MDSKFTDDLPKKEQNDNTIQRTESNIASFRNENSGNSNFRTRNKSIHVSSNGLKNLKIDEVNNLKNYQLHLNNGIFKSQRYTYLKLQLSQRFCYLKRAYTHFGVWV